MNANDYWSMFMKTGAPEIYLMYKNAKDLEEGHVSDGSRTCAAGNGLPVSADGSPLKPEVSGVETIRCL